MYQLYLGQRGTHYFLELGEPNVIDFDLYPARHSVGPIDEPGVERAR
jgi:hypothetical protein